MPQQLFHQQIQHRRCMNRYSFIRLFSFSRQIKKQNYILFFQEAKLHTFLLHKVVEPADNKEFQSLLASFRASGGMLKKKIKSNISLQKNT